MQWFPIKLHTKWKYNRERNAWVHGHILDHVHIHKVQCYLYNIIGSISPSENLFNGLQGEYFVKYMIV